MAGDLGKVIRGGRSGGASVLTPAICRRGLQDGVAGSSPASPAAGTSRPLEDQKKTAMAATLKVIRGGCSSASSMLIPAICCSGLQEGAVGSSMASPAAGTSRLMHMGQWRNSLPQQKALPFGRCGVLSQGVKMEQLINYRTTCNLPRMSDGVKGLRQKYMRVPRYEVYGSEFSILYLWNQINGVGKVINGYKQNWSYPVGIVFVVACIGACAIDGYTNNKRNVKMLAGIKSNTKKAAGTVKETAQILQEIEEAICKEEEGKQ